MNIIITGASQGIGRETVKIFAEMGNHVIYAVSRNKDKLQVLAEECKKINDHSSIIAVPMDLIDLIQNRSALSERVLLPDHIDILINNAGMLINKPFEDITAAEATGMLNINFIVPAILIRELRGHLGTKGKTHIVNISSMGGFQGSSKYPGLSFYSASKAALAVLTECLPAEFKNSDISFNCLCLGAAQTEMLDKAFPGYKAKLSAREMAEYIVDFAIKGHKYFNGKIIPVAFSNP